MIDLEPIFQAVRQAAILCSWIQEKHFVKSEKDGHEPVTTADYGSQAIICRAISLAFPDDAVLAEEQGSQFMTLVAEPQRMQVVELLSQVLGETVHQDEVVRWLDYGTERQTKRTWVIDPIDGTKGFVAMRHYAIAVGILEHGAPVGGIMAAPGYPDVEGGVLFFAQDGQAYRQPLKGGSAQPIRVSDHTESSQMRIVQSFEKGHSSRERMERVRQLAGMADSQIDDIAFIDSMEKYGRVACGDADLYLRLTRAGSTFQHKVWDHAAGTALVQAAGGRATDLDGSPLDFSQGQLMPNRGMIVSNGHIHERVLEAVQTVLRAEEPQP